jgi:hypothetical protein
LALRDIDRAEGGSEGSGALPLDLLNHRHNRQI